MTPYRHSYSRSPIGEHDLDRLLRWLVDDDGSATTWEGWHLSEIHGGANNRIYRAKGHDRDLAIKWTIRDGRRRARREYQALCVLAERSLAIAPHPVLVDEHYPQPVVVYDWLAGDTSITPPHTDHAWMQLLEHLVTIHTITPQSVSHRLEPAVLSARSTSECRQLIRQQLALLPETARPKALPPLIQQLETVWQHTWNEAPLALCRVDSNTTNFVRRPDLWASIDWENSGWGDPAFEIADLMSHPAYLDVAPQRWTWVIAQYCQRTHGEATAHRIKVYYRTMLVWWVIRFARTLYEVPRGGDRRLAERPANWREDVEHKLERAIERAHHTLNLSDGGTVNL